MNKDVGIELVEDTFVWYSPVALFNVRLHIAVKELAEQVIWDPLVTKNEGAYCMSKYDGLSAIVILITNEDCYESIWLVNW